MTCSICGTRTGPGAMLCRPCKSALKRARQFTVQAFPDVPVAVAGPDDAVALPAPPGRRRRGRAAPRNPRIALAVLAVTLFAAAAFVGGRGMASAHAERQGPALVPLALRTPLPPPQFAVASRGVLPAAPGAAPAAVRRIASPPPAASAVATAASAADPSPPAIALAQAPEPHVSSATAAAAPAPDRWQAVSDALARCADEGGLGGFICDQRVRLNACDGHWGRVAQCPAPSLPANPR